MWKLHIERELTELHEKTQLRTLKITENGADQKLILAGKEQLNLASNNYLSLANDPRLKWAAIDALKKYGTGAAASRLVTGNHPLYGIAEEAVKLWKKQEAALIVNSGYTANIGMISALAGRNTIIFSDKLNHASIVDGVILSRAEFKRYRHNDMDQLAKMLAQAPTDKLKIIITDTVFSMDGDVANLAMLVQLKKRYNAMLIVDEAHGTGVFGPNGEGYCHELGLENDIDLIMGTFSKAFGCYGAYITGSVLLIEYLLNKMRSFIYTTALPPAVLGSIIKAIEIVQKEPERREQLQSNGLFFRNALEAYGFHIYNSVSSIIPIRVGSNALVLEFSSLLQAAGLAAIAIRPPTVAENDARIRFTVIAGHKRAELATAVETIAAVGKRLGVIS